MEARGEEWGIPFPSPAKFPLMPEAVPAVRVSLASNYCRLYVEA